MKKQSIKQKAKRYVEALELAKKLQQTEVVSGKNIRPLSSMTNIERQEWELILVDEFWEPFLKNIRDVDKPLLTNLYNELAEFLMHHDGVVNADIGTDIVLFAAVRRLFCAGVRHIEFDGFVKSCSDFFRKYKTCLQRDDSDEWRGTCLYFFCSSYIFEMLNNGKYSIEEVLDGQSEN